MEAREDSVGVVVAAGPGKDIAGVDGHVCLLSSEEVEDH